MCSFCGYRHVGVLTRAEVEQWLRVNPLKEKLSDLALTIKLSVDWYLDDNGRLGICPGCRAVLDEVAVASLIMLKEVRAKLTRGGDWRPVLRRKPR